MAVRTRVSIGDIKSDMKKVLMGVPQGSVLGPILLFLYINDFCFSSNTLDFHLFADDSNLFYSCRHIDDLERTLNSELLNINNWLFANKLSLNIEKSKFVVFRPLQKKTPSPLKLAINNRQLKQVLASSILGSSLMST